MTLRKLLVPPLLLLALTRWAPALEAQPRVAADVQALLAAGEARVPVLVAFRSAQGRDRALALQRPGFALRRALSGGVAATVTRQAFAALANDPDVLEIALDGIVHPAGQVGTAQIGADRLLSIGLDGSGRSVAIVDTGIDTTSAALGGGPIPNAKVLAGWNVVTQTAEVSDCAGHGTEVAGVVAGPAGVAPGASLVALKIFGGDLGCAGALYSDVLAAVDWAVSHRDAYRIEAVNLSLSGDPVRAGFCDSEDPVSAAVFRGARSAGLAVVAASGNDARTDGIAWPGCFSDVTAVGMVYSASAGSVSWDGTNPCVDRTTGADVVPCASNSGAALGLLAPGVRWVTTAAGGGLTQSFSGTSAAAPAAAAAFVLARQARPASDPALAMDALRATGVPVGDDKNGRVAARVDLGAALDAPSAATGACDAASIPESSPGGLRCTAEVSALVGNVSSLAVALSIDHPDPTQLVVTLTGPEGTSVVLMDHSGSRGHAVREVFGRTVAPVEPLSRFAGRPAAGVWTLSVVDTQPGDAGRLVSWALQIEPEAARTVSGPVVRSSVIPTAVRAAGRFGSFFTTDVRLFNSDAASAQPVTLRFRSASADVPDRSVTVAVPPHGTRILSDVVGDAFRTADHGMLFVDAAPSILTGSLTSSGAPGGGRLGLFVPAVPTGAGISAVTPSLTLIPPFRGGGFRVNVGLTEMAGTSADAEITIKDGHGAPKGVLSARVPPLSVVQVNDVYTEARAPQSDNDRIEVRVVGGTGRVVPYATALDNRTNDGTFVGGSAAAGDLLLPAVANASGLYGAVFRTDVKLANPGSSPIRVRVTYLPAVGDSAEPVVISLGGGETVLMPDILASLFALPAPAAGALRFTALGGARLVATSRTYCETSSGTFGFSTDPGSGIPEAAPGQRLALTFLTDDTETRTNVGFVETGGVRTSARVTLFGTDGSALAVREVSLDASTAVNWSGLFGTMGLAGGRGSAIVEVLSGGKLAAYSIQVDNRTNDSSLVPAARIP